MVEQGPSKMTRWRQTEQVTYDATAGKIPSGEKINDQNYRK